ncbi:hypothetical protein VI26_03285 [Chromobacterium sp. LK1]|nr:hypothetical protein VI26_03285 [Chromobacterium sp. LK1]
MMMTTENRKKQGPIRKSGPELLSHFCAVVADRLEKNGQTAKQASEIALGIMEYLRKEFGGQNVYFPMGITQSNEAKAIEILDKFYAGTTVQDLAYEYQYSIQWVYRIIADERARRRQEREEDKEAKRAKEHERWSRENY